MAQQRIQVRSFTTQAPRLVNTLLSEVTIQEPNKPKGGKKYIAVWDTGAQRSCITQRVIKDLGLLPSGKMFMIGATGKKLVNTFKIFILLPNNVRVGTNAAEINDLTNPDAKTQLNILIGMDVINLGDFVCF